MVDHGTLDDVGFLVDFDSAVWLPGPVEGAVTEWTERAYAACRDDFGVDEGSIEAEYLRALLAQFATADVGGDLRFLLLRNLIDVPLVARISAFGEAGLEVSDHFAALDPEGRFYDEEPRIEVLDTQTGLRRALAFEVGDEGIHSVVRYHRRVADWDVDFVLACAGADINATAIGLDELDRLARAVWFINPEGERR